MNDLVSVIIPVYNTKKEYLDECVQSVINQNYKSLEIIIVDDGSNSETAQLCETYKLVDSRIRIIHKKNEGVSVARNVGINNAIGRWITFVDSDDWIEKNFLDGIEEYTENDVIAFKRVICEGMTLTISDSWYTDKFLIEGEEETSKLIRKILINDDYSSSLGMVISKIYNLNFLRMNNIFFTKDIPFREDTIFNISLLSHFPKIFFEVKSVYNYRVNQLSVTHKKDNKCIENSKKLIAACKKEVKEKYLNEYYAFVIWQLNYVCINSIFNKYEQNKISLLKKTLEYAEYMEAIKNVNLKLLSKRKKILVILIRKKCYCLLRYLYCNIR